MATLKELRLDQFMSQDRLAVRAGLAKTTIIDLEKGRTKPQPITVRKLAKALNVAPDKIEFP